MRFTFLFLSAAVVLWLGTACPSLADNPAIQIPLQYGVLSIQQNGNAQIQFTEPGSGPDQKTVQTSGLFSAFELKLKDGKRVSVASVQKESVEKESSDVRSGKQTFSVVFENGLKAVFSCQSGKGFAAFQGETLIGEPAVLEQVNEFSLFRLGVPKDAQVSSTIGTARFEGKTISIVPGSINVRPVTMSSQNSRSDKPGCSHEFLPTQDSAPNAAGTAEQTGTAGQTGTAVRFSAASSLPNAGGWSVQCGRFSNPLDLSNCKGLSVWVFGDGNGESFKIQLYDSKNGYRDDYVPITFNGWKKIELTAPALNSLDYSNVVGMNFYYNGLPASKSVEIRFDDVEAFWGANADAPERKVVLENFEDPQSQYWDFPSTILTVRSYAKFDLAPAAFGVIACPSANWTESLEAFQLAAGIPHIMLRGEWAKTASWVRESYFFLTNFKQDQTDEALALIKRGKFRHSLVEQHSWSLGSGHYVINDKRFENGIEGLKATAKRFNDEGVTFGLHLLGAGIEPPDAYITPVPDKRLLTGAEAKLADAIDEKADFIPTAEPPAGFLAQEGENSYTTTGTVIWIDDELIRYEKASMEKPYGFTGCKRGWMGTKPAAHENGQDVKYLVRSYGYHKYDQRSTLADEVARNLAAVADEIGVNMLYFDGSEWLDLEGADHWYFNARLQKTFFDALKNKQVLIQASSWSPYSWHFIPRSASADGHADLKAYLEQRASSFQSRVENLMALDIGWYYCYDKKATLDMYEYVLNATIGYNSSMSFQTSVDAAKAHPFTGEILDLIGKYEDLRLSGRITDELRENFIINPKLFGLKTQPERDALVDLRKDYRLLGDPGQEYFQRVRYGLWHEVGKSGNLGENAASSATAKAENSAANAADNNSEWSVEIKESGRIGFDIQVIDALTKENSDQKLANPTLTFIAADGSNAGKTVGELVEPLALSAQQYGISWPGEKIGRYGVPLTQGEYLDQRGRELRLEAGRYTVRFAADNPNNLSVRVRITVQTDEKLAIPSAKSE